MGANGAFLAGGRLHSRSVSVSWTKQKELNYNKTHLLKNKADTPPSGDKSNFRHCPGRTIVANWTQDKAEPCERAGSQFLLSPSPSVRIPPGASGCWPVCMQSKFWSSRDTNEAAE